MLCPLCPHLFGTGATRTVAEHQEAKFRCTHNWIIRHIVPTSASLLKMTTNNTKLTNVLLIGAGGNVGATVLDAFASDPRFTVSILTRKSSKSIFPSHLTIHRVSDDYPASELVSAFRGHDAIVVTISRASAHKQKDFIDAAVKAGVKRFVPSEFGGDTRDEKALAILPQLYGKKNEVVDYLKGKEKDSLTWSAFVTGPIFEL